MDIEKKALWKQLHDIVETLETYEDDKQEPVKQVEVNSIALDVLDMTKAICWEYDYASNSVHKITFVHHEVNKIMVNTLSGLLDKIPLEERKKVSNAMYRLIHEEETQQSFVIRLDKDGGSDFYNVCARSYKEDHKLKVIGVLVFSHHEDCKEREAQEAQQKFELLLNIANMYLWEFEVELAIFTCNAALCKKLGLEQKVYTLEELQTIVEIDELKQFLESIQKTKTRIHDVIHIRKLNDNEQIIFECSFNSVADCEGNTTLVLGTLNDITEQEILKLKASRDPLTGCYNRSSADMTLTSSFQKFKETGELYTLIFFDVDKFKEVNDKYGHDAGDYVLKHFALCIMQESRSTDRLFRWGGDEFLLICGGIAKENMYTHIERLRRVMEGYPFVYEKTKLQITTSIGAAYYYRNDTDFSMAMKRADRSVYKSKLAGRNKACMLLK